MAFKIGHKPWNTGNVAYNKILFNDADLSKIKELYLHQGSSAEDIGLIMDVSKPTILKTLRSLGIDTSKKVLANYFSSVDKKKMADIYLNNKVSMAEIGKYFNVSRTTIRYILLSQGISLRENGPQIGKLNLKCSETRKKLFKEGKIIPARGMLGKHHSKESKLKISLKELGEKNPFYGKRHTIQTRIKLSALKKEIPLEKWKSFSKNEQYDINWSIGLKNQIRKRDNQICMNCGIHREKLKEALTIHHVNYDKKCTVEQNCISLCRKCHGLTIKNRDYWQKLFQEKLAKIYDYKYLEGKIIIKLYTGNEQNVEL